MASTTSEDKTQGAGVASPQSDVDEEKAQQSNDEEKAQPTPQQEESSQLATWDSPNDPENPYNWPTPRKVSIALVFSTGQLVQLMSSSMIAAPLPQIAADLGMTASVAQMAFSIYVLGLAVGPFLNGPLSEIYGRKPVWIVCNLYYILWNSLCPVGNSRALMITGRLMTGLGASVGIGLTSAVLTDMYKAKDRGKSLAIATFLPYLGPALGPIVGGVVSQYVHWPFLFWVLSIFDAILVLVGLFVTQETCAFVLLRRKAAKAEKAHPESALPSLRRVSTRERTQTAWTQIRTAFLRPIRLLLYHPITLFISLNLSLNFAIYFLILSTYAVMWIERYQQSQSVSSLNYIAIALGGTFATQGGGLLMDLIYRRMKARGSGAATPEFRVPYMVPWTVLVPVSLFWYGWAAELRAHWLAVDVGAAVFTGASFALSQGYYAYMFDEFPHTASANAAVRLLSNILAFAFPLFAPQLYGRLGYGWGNSLLAFVFMAVGFPSLVVLWLWGPKLRAFKLGGAGKG